MSGKIGRGYSFVAALLDDVCKSKSFKATRLYELVATYFQNNCKELET
jgi:hypothetical protein